jgi:hypothetical protein
MDVDWCLSCGRHIVRFLPLSTQHLVLTLLQKPETVYCSQQCRYSDSPSSSHGLCYIDESNSESHSESCEDDDDDDDVVYHVIEDASSKPTSRWAGNGPEGIAAWAKDIPCGPPEQLTHDITFLPHSPPRKQFPPPKLLLPYRRPVPPTLCMSTPHPTRPQPSVPITTPQQHIASLSLTRSTSEDFGSVTTSGTESIATPSSLAVPHPLASDTDLPRKECMFANLTALCPWGTAPSHLPASSPALTHTPLPSQPRRRTDSASFTVLAKTHSTSALRLISSPDETDESSSEDDGIWWLSGTSGFNDEKSSSKLKGSSAKIRLTGERGCRPVAGLSVDHPAYRARGRKLSRNIA